MKEMIGDELSDSCQHERRRGMAQVSNLSIFSSGLPFFRYRSAFVKCSFRITASWRSLPISRFFSLTSFSNGRARSRSFDVASSKLLASVARASTSRNCF